jgi:hypothetical protein
VRYPKLVRKFHTTADQEWRIYHAPAKQFPSIFKIEGRWRLGLTFFSGKRKNRIYIDSSQPDQEIWDTTCHEITHVCLRDLGLLEVIEEPFVDEFASRLAFILEQLGK